MEHADVLLGIIHTNVCGPMNVATRNGLRYFMTFNHDLSRYGYIYLMKHKSETFEKFKEFQNEVENQLRKKSSTFDPIEVASIWVTSLAII